MRMEDDRQGVMTQEPSNRRKVEGRVKWFDPVKGFGFIASEGSDDILLHANVLHDFGQSSVAEESGITLIAQKTARGIQAVEVLEIKPPETGGKPSIDDLGGCNAAEIAALPLHPSRVRWFDKVRGFGFANIYGQPEDVFIHIEVLRRSGFTNLQPGEAICVRVVDGKRGRMAAQVVSWEAAWREKK